MFSKLLDSLAVKFSGAADSVRRQLNIHGQYPGIAPANISNWWPAENTLAAGMARPHKITN